MPSSTTTNIKLIQFELTLMLAIEDGNGRGDGDSDGGNEDSGGNVKKLQIAKDRQIDEQRVHRDKESEASV